MRKPHWEVAKPLVEKMRIPVPHSSLDTMDKLEKVSGALYEWAEKSPENHFQLGSGFGTGWAQSFISTLGSFYDGPQKIYKVAREFGQELAKTKLDIPLHLAPETDGILCIELPESMRFESTPGDFIHCTYIFSDSNPTGTRTSGRDKRPYIRRYVLFSPVYNEKGELTPIADTYAFSFYEGMGTVHEALEESRKFKGPDIQVDGISAMWRVNEGHTPAYPEFFLKVLLYLKSGDPDLRHHRAPKAPTDSPKKLRKWLKANESQSLVDMTLVGYDWKKPRHYSTDSTVVSGHFRWQPYGPGRTEVKLIWIDQHERRFSTG